MLGQQCTHNAELVAPGYMRSADSFGATLLGKTTATAFHEEATALRMVQHRAALIA